MPKWTDYTIKTDPADKDEVMVLDIADKANKRLGLSALSDWILNKLADKTFQKLATSNKTIIGAINALNSEKLSNLLTYIGKGPDSGQNERAPSYDFTNEDDGFYLVLNTNNNITEHSYFGAFCIVMNVKNHDTITFSNSTVSNTEHVFSANGKTLNGTSLSWSCYLMVYKINLTFTIQ